VKRERRWVRQGVKMKMPFFGWIVKMLGEGGGDRIVLDVIYDVCDL
jgi:hypothetical protein